MTPDEDPGWWPAIWPAIHLPWTWFLPSRMRRLRAERPDLVAVRTIFIGLMLSFPLSG